MQTDAWFERFVELHFTNSIGRDTRKLKVAILDSGIQYDHVDLTQEDRRRIQDTVSFIGLKPRVDESELHGTRIAATILRLTKNVDLSIAQVTSSRKFKSQRGIVEVRYMLEIEMIDG
jgi:hypothetical protein